jgi:2-methylene-furan-3-one reductase
MLWYMKLVLLGLLSILFATSPSFNALVLPSWVLTPYLEYAFPLIRWTLPESFVTVNYKEYGTSDPSAFPAFTLESTPVPLACRNPNAVLVQVMSSALNPADCKIVQGFTRYVLPPFVKHLDVPGMDFSGTIAGLPASPSSPAFFHSFSVGDAVYGMNSFVDQSTLASHVCVDARFIALKPKELSFNEAASLPLAAQTSFDAVRIASLGLDFSTPKKILVLGGGSATGSLAVQFAKTLFDFDYVAATASRRSAERVRAYGADLIVDYADPHIPWEDNFLNFHVVKDFDVVFDTVGGDDVYDKVKKLVRPGGRFVTVVGDYPHGPLTATKILRVVRFTVTRNMQAIIDYGRELVGLGCRTCCGVHPFFYQHTTTNSNTAFLDQLNVKLASGEVKTNVGMTFQFTVEDIKLAFEFAENGKAGGKVVIENVKQGPSRKEIEEVEAKKRAEERLRVEKEAKEEIATKKETEDAAAKKKKAAAGEEGRKRRGGGDEASAEKPKKKKKKKKKTAESGGEF